PIVAALRAPLIPYTTLFRSWRWHHAADVASRSPRTLRTLADCVQRLHGGVAPTTRTGEGSAGNHPGLVPHSGVQVGRIGRQPRRDRKSTRLNSSHQIISYAV